ncbi:endonuclease/exonuclease/phosphatase family protein [Aeromicrobium duanguangcaii]|uniref:Fibronectin type-III domain-containing protein n=1 Tax=Aeromicrobium duanguangcaii TaxID=2968086 RepID=A0ABY5KGC1_9ACTN|nr:endonuclease/exonuclease/phosphatase family protein [Aeromicrobium duanguangcaii]MCD9154119.1 hypothetical protein [Aeromicrobium duanguangcaii]UUI68808.1 hypothetical protein NP095_01475 [Aeromicrobium duanguangcaii]
MPSSLLRRALVTLALTSTVLVAPATAAEAAPAKPAKVTKVSAKTTTTTLTIRWKRPKRAKSFSVCVKTAPKSKRCVRNVRTRKTSVTFRKLKPNSGHDFYYRVRSYRGKKYSAATNWKRANLRVGKGTANSVVGGSGDRLAYRWSRSTSATTYQLQLATDRRFTTGVHTVGRKNPAATVTGLNGGMTYYARARGVNGTVKGAWGPVSKTRLAPKPVRATVATYNLCGEDKCRSADSPAWFLRYVPKWSVRKPLAAAVVRSADPDIIVTQESATKTAFHTALPGFTRGAYKSAKTIYFRSSRFSALDGGWMTLDSETKRYATWNLLRDRQAGTAFIVVDAHLEPQKGKARDDRRRKQTARLISRISALNPHGLPVVWGGDWNSNASNANQSNYPGGYDAPRREFERHGVVDALTLTTNTINAELNSANAGVPTPKANGHHVDGIYVPLKGVQVESWLMPANFVETPEGRQYATPFPSDHNPVVTKLVLATP